MKEFKFYIIVLMLVVFGCQPASGPLQGDEELAVIPRPVEIELYSGHYTVKNNTVIYCNNKESLPVAKYINTRLRNALGFSFKIKEGTGEGINLKISGKRNDNIGDEGYTLSVTPSNIDIVANTANGVFYGIQTLIQMLPPEAKSSTLQAGITWAVPCAKIVDKPRFPWRGLLLDVSRHFFTKEEVKEYIDELAEYKMNICHLHLTDDQGWRIEIKSLPKLTAIGAWRAERVGDWWGRTPREENEPTNYGGFYTHEDISEIVQYAKERFVNILPEIECPGHSLAAIVAYPEISCTQTVKDINVGNKFYKIDENSLCVGKEKTFEYLDRIFSEVAMLFPFDYVHVGGDECYKGFWSKCPDCQKRLKDQKLKDTDELQSYFIKRVEKILEAKNKKLVGWDEILEGGLSPNATVMSWRGMKGGIAAAKQGHKVVMAPNNHTYLDLYQGEPSVEPTTYGICRLTNSYEFEPVPDGVDPQMILGGQGNLWTESVPTFRHAEYMTWPRGWALAEVLWSPKERKDWRSFTKRVEQHFLRADYGNINYSRSMYNAIITPFVDEDANLKIRLSTELDGLSIYYTFDNTNPDLYSQKYESPLSIPKNATRLKVITYRGNIPIGKMINFRLNELVKSINI